MRPHHLLALVPLAALLGAPFVANRVEPRILGLPFLLAWCVGALLAMRPGATPEAQRTIDAEVAALRARASWSGQASTAALIASAAAMAVARYL